MDVLGQSLLELSLDIQRTRADLVNRPDTQGHTTRTPPHPDPGASLDFLKSPLPPLLSNKNERKPSSRLSRFTSALTQPFNLWTDHKRPMTGRGAGADSLEHTALLCPGNELELEHEDRISSAPAHETAKSPRQTPISPSDLLAALAPLISTIQRLGLSPHLEAAREGGMTLRHRFVAVCNELCALLLTLQAQTREPEEDRAHAHEDGHITEPNSYSAAIGPGRDDSDSEPDMDNEMRALLLSALIRKVRAEKAKHGSPLTSILPLPGPIRTDMAEAGSGGLTSTADETETEHLLGGSSGPHKQDQADPFVLHAPSLISRSRASSRASASTISSSRFIPRVIPSLDSDSQTQSSSYMSTQQEPFPVQCQTWRMNVHRIASFQSSALFTNSPVAVLKPMSVASVSKMP